MAAAKSSRTNMEQLNDITECCICLKQFTDPRMLPCIHTFCLQCIKDFADMSDKKPGDAMPCPLCRKEFTIPNDGVQGIQENFFMARFIEVQEVNLLKMAVIPCDVCEEITHATGAIKSEAKWRCLDCQDNLCESCCKVHKTFKVSKSHEILEIGCDVGVDEIVRSIQMMNCDIHRGKDLDYYCAECKKVVCVSCLVESHRTHDCKDIKTAEEEFRKIIKSSANVTSALAGELLEKKKKFETTMHFIKKMAEREKEILFRSEELKKMIDEHTKSLLSSLDKIKNRHFKEIQTEEYELERRFVILESFSRYCDIVWSKGSAIDICRTKAELLQRADELEEDHKNYITRLRVSSDVTFHATDLDNLLKIGKGNIIGSINDALAMESSYTKQPGKYTKENISLDERMAMLKRVRTFELDGLKITNCIFKRDHLEICYLLDDSCAVHDKEELRQQLADHLKIDSKLIKMAKLRAKPIYKATTLRPGDSANIYSKVACRIGAFVHVEGKGIHALMSGHGRSPGDMLLYPNGDRLGVVNISLHPSLQPNDDNSYCGYTDVALAKLEQQDRYIAQVYNAIHGQLHLMEQPAEAEEGMEVRCFDANGTGGIIESTAYIRQDEELKLDWRLISISNDTGGPVHEEGESGILIVCDTPDQRRVKAIGILVGVDELLFDDEEETTRRTSLAVPLTISFEGLQDDPYCNGGAIKFLH